MSSHSFFSLSNLFAWSKPVDKSSWLKTITSFYYSHEDLILAIFTPLLYHIACTLFLKLSQFICQATWAFISSRRRVQEDASPYRLIVGQAQPATCIPTPPPRSIVNLQPIETLRPNLNALAVRKGPSLEPTLPPPAKFNRHKDVDQWIKTFEFYVQTNGIVNKVQTLLASLDDDTFQSITSIKGINFHDSSCYESLKTALSVLYSKPQPSVQNLHKQFKERNQRPDETLALYFLTLTNFGELAYPDASSEHLRSIVTERFIDGLADPRVKLHLLTTGFPMTEDVLSAATRIQRAYEQVCPAAAPTETQVPPQQSNETMQWSQKQSTRWTSK